MPAAARLRQRIAAYALVRDGSCVLLVRASAASGVGGTWFLPGGGVEHGEDPADAVVREVREETGYACEVGDVLAVTSDVFHSRRTGDDVHSIRVIYRARIAGGRLTAEEQGSSDEARWFEPGDASALTLVAFTRAVLERHAKD